MRPQDVAAFGIKTFGNNIAFRNALDLHAGTLDAVGNQRRMAVIHTDDSRLTTRHQPFFDVGIMLHRAMPIEMVRREVKQNAGSRIDRRRQIDLVGRALDYIEALRLRRIEAQHRRADIAAEPAYRGPKP